MLPETEHGNGQPLIARLALKRKDAAQQRRLFRPRAVRRKDQNELQIFADAELLKRRYQHPRFIKRIRFERRAGQFFPGRNILLKRREILYRHNEHFIVPAAQQVYSTAQLRRIIKSGGFEDCDC